MNFQLISDVHGRFSKVEWDNSADIILAAGDISENIEEGHKFLRTAPAPVLFIPGNHEYYNGDYLERQDRMKELCETSNGQVTYLDQEVAIIDDTRIIATTLWSNFGNLDPILVESAYGLMNDYKKIRTTNYNKNKNMAEHIENLKNIHLERRKKIYMDGGMHGKKIEDLFYVRNKNSELEFNIDSMDNFDTNKFSPFFSYFLNKKSTLWLENALSQPFNGKTIVMTHHAPSRVALSLGDYLANPLGLGFGNILLKKMLTHKIGAYTTSMEKMVMKYDIDSWVHGHFHEFMNYRLGTANVICNPTGNRTTPMTGYDTYIFTTNPIEKKIALNFSLNKYLNILMSIKNWLHYEIKEQTDFDNLNYSCVLDAIWDEINIIILNLCSLPKQEIPEDFFVDLNNPIYSNEYLSSPSKILKYQEINLGLTLLLDRVNDILPLISKWKNLLSI